MLLIACLNQKVCSSVLFLFLFFFSSSSKDNTCKWLLNSFVALLVHISVLEQQGKYDTAREVLLESGPNLLVIEVDRLRIEVLSEAFASCLRL